MTDVYLSPSRIFMWETCGRQYQLRYIEKEKEEATGHALVVGRAVDEAIEVVLYDMYRGGSGSIGPEAFEEAFTKQVTTEIVQWGSRHDEEELRTIGRGLLGAFASKWKASRLTPLVGPDGRLLTQRKLRVRLGKNVVFTAIPDLIAADENGNVVVPDFKAAAQPSPDGYADQSDQLTAYQILVDAHADSLGLPGRVERLGFFEGIKLKTKHGWHWAEGQRRSELAVSNYLSKVMHVAENIERGYFPERSGWAFNSPCSMCAHRISCRARLMETIVPNPIMLAA